MSVETAAFEQWWKAVAPHLPMARLDAVAMLRGDMTPGDATRMWAKARAGWVEHGGGILTMPDVAVLHEAEAEVDDLTVYLAALRERRYRRMRQATAF